MILSFKMALRSISANKMRAVLTMLGIIIGVMALVVLVSLVNGATNSVTSAVADLGSSLITVSVTDDNTLYERLEALGDRLDGSAALSEIETELKDIIAGIEA